MAKFDLKTFNPMAFGMYIKNVPNLKKSEFIKSGVLCSNKDIRNAFSGATGTAYAILPMYGNLDGDTLNYDGNTDIVATGTTTYTRGAVVFGRAKAWTERDFSEDITGGAGFMDNVARQVSNFWFEKDQETLLSVLKGCFSMTGKQNEEFVNNHSYDISVATNTNLSPTTLNTAMDKACEHNKNAFSLVVMHSSVATNLENMQALEYFKYTDANGVQRDLSLATWNGRTVLIDNDATIFETGATPTDTKYVTYVLGKGAISYEDLGAKVPYEMARNPYKNGGETTLITRHRKCFAPFGISFKSQNATSPTDVEFAKGTNWELVNDGAGKTIDHRSIPIARIISKG